MTADIDITDVLTPGGTVTYWDAPPTDYPTNFDPVTRLTECPMWPDGPCMGGAGPATAEPMTSAERMTITPAAGKLIYDTDLEILYVGDGETVGGKAVDGGSSADFTRVTFHDPANS